MDYSKIQEPCFVCRVEDKLGQVRGTQSHPITCGWRIKHEHEMYERALRGIYDLGYAPDRDPDKLFNVIDEIRSISAAALVRKYDGDTNYKGDKI